jgi:hypothetical protein
MKFMSVSATRPTAVDMGTHMSIVLSRIGFVGAMVVALAVATGASSEPTKKAKPQKVSLGPTEVELRRSVFSGNELRVYPFYAVNADCTSMPADIRVVKEPTNGEVAFREARSVIELLKSSPRAHCNRKPVQSVVMFYTSKEDFSGRDKMTVDVDFGTGSVLRYNVTVDVR